MTKGVFKWLAIFLFFFKKKTPTDLAGVFKISFDA
jgi:hypothetical protein